jgi:hypothetical protein
LGRQAIRQNGEKTSHRSIDSDSFIYSNLHKGVDTAMNDEQMDMEFNPPPSPDELFNNPRSQNYRLYDRLLVGPVTNEEISSRDGLHLLSYARRISEVRRKLRPLNWDIKAYRVTGSLFAYQLTAVN